MNIENKKQLALSARRGVGVDGRCPDRAAYSGQHPGRDTTAFQGI